MDSLRSTAAAAVTLLVVLPFAVTAVGDSFGSVPDPASAQAPESAPEPQPAASTPAPAPFGVPQTSVAPAPVPAGAQIPGDG